MSSLDHLGKYNGKLLLSFQITNYSFHCGIPQAYSFFSQLKANLKVWKNKMEHSGPKSNVYVVGI